jgi:hypothetical protein
MNTANLAYLRYTWMTFDPARRAMTKVSLVQITVLEDYGARDNTPASLIDILNSTAQHLLQDAYHSLCLRKDRNLIQKWDPGDYEILFPPPKGQILDELIQNMIKKHTYR